MVGYRARDTWTGWAGAGVWQVNECETCTRAASWFLCDLAGGGCLRAPPAIGTFQADDGWTLRWYIPCGTCTLKCPPPDCGTPGDVAYYDAEGTPKGHASGQITTEDLTRALSKFKAAHNVRQLELAL